MEKARITGPGAGVYKYDMLTALTMWGLRGSPCEQVSALRLVALVTARYNWQRDEVSIGHKDLARLWGVTERTVKREIKRLIDLDLLTIQRPGVRGRVASYRLVADTVANLSAPLWDQVGPDFAGRFTERQNATVRQEGPQVLRVDFQRRSQGGGATPSQAEDGPQQAQDSGAGDPWSRLQAQLRTAAPKIYSAWFSGLTLTDVTEDRVTLGVQSAFVQRYVETHFNEILSAAVRDAFGAETQLSLVVAK